MLSGGTAETLQCDSGLLHGMRSVCAMPFVRTGVGVAAVGHMADRQAPLSLGTDRRRMEKDMETALLLRAVQGLGFRMVSGLGCWA